MPTEPARPVSDAPADDAPPQVEQQRHVRAAPQTVWEVLTDPDQRRQVLGGDLDVDLVEGARGTWSPSDEGESSVHVRKVDHSRRLVFDWGDGDDAATVDIRLLPVGAGTSVRVVETRRSVVAAPRASGRATLCLAA